MIIKCPECNLQISDKAFFCPHCGYPLQQNVVKPKRTSSKRMRLPNGFGQISEIKNRNLRCPFRAMVTVGFSETGRPISKILKPRGYFKTYNEAYEALMEYNKNPYEINSDATVEDIYNRWSEEYLSTHKAPTTLRSLTSSWNKITPIKDMYIKEVKPYHIKELLKTINLSPVSVSKAKTLLNQLFDYAVEYDLISSNPARNIKLDYKNANGDYVTKTHIDFTDNEIYTMFNHKDNYYVSMMLIQCYMGWRPQELINIKLENVDLDNWTIKGGMKTEAGTNRIVPIHECIRDLVKEKYLFAKSYKMDTLFVYTESKYKQYTSFNYDIYRVKFKEVLKTININPLHRAHDPRVHFVTQCKKYNVDQYAIKYMVGHSIKDITESVYTKRSAKWYAEELAKIKNPCKR